MICLTQPFTDNGFINHFLNYRFAFRIYDIDNDGYISNGELFQVVQQYNKWDILLIPSFHVLGVKDDGGQ